MRRNKVLIRNLVCITLVIACVSSISAFLLSRSKDSQAASLANFNAGNIISDYTMSNANTMNVADIQRFLESHENCNDTRIYIASQYPSVHYHIENGHFVCMAQERFSEGYAYGDLVPGGVKTQSAAEIIYEVSQQYQINPQVLLVLLEKEQGLVSDSFPNSIQYRSATGFGCPDTAACDSQYYGLKNQLKFAANLFRTVLNGGWTNYPVGYNYVQYNPNTGCGGSVINIENRATSALYRYTPYQPNQGALNAGYGTSYCGSYGNRNFYLFFSDWFGDPASVGGEVYYYSFVELQEPRYFKLNKGARTVNADNGFSDDGGTQFEKDAWFYAFRKKYINGGWCYQSREDYDNDINYCMPVEHLDEIVLETHDLPQSNIMYGVAPGSSKVNVIKGRSVFEFEAGRTVTFVKYFEFQGKKYYVTKYDIENSNYNIGVSEDDIVVVPNKYKLLDNPMEIVLLKDTDRIYDSTGEYYDTLREGSVLKVSSTIDINGITYYRTEHNTFNNIECVFDSRNTARTNEYVAMDGVSLMLKTDANRIDPVSGRYYDTLKAGTILTYSSKIFANGKWHYRTEHNTRFGINAAVDSELLTDVADFEVLENVETRRLLKNVSRVNPYTGSIYDTLPEGLVLGFSSRININGVWYYRTEHNTKYGIIAGIPESELSDPF